MIRLLTHRAWISVAAVVSVLSIAVAVLAVTMSSGSSNGIEVTGVTMSKADEINAMVTSRGNADPGAEYPTETVPVDVSIKNNTGADVTITEIRGEVLHFAGLDDCSRSGAGPGVIEAFYSLPIPIDPYGEDGKPKLDDPKVTAPAEFTVNAGSVHRMNITLGPKAQANGSARLITMAVKIDLVFQNGETIPVGTAGIVSQVRSVTHIMDVMENSQMNTRTDSILSECLRTSLSAFDKVTRVSTVRSPFLDQLQEFYRQRV